MFELLESMYVDCCRLFYDNHKQSIDILVKEYENPDYKVVENVIYEYLSHMWFKPIFELQDRLEDIIEERGQKSKVLIADLVKGLDTYSVCKIFKRMDNPSEKECASKIAGLIDDSDMRVATIVREMYLDEFMR